VDYQTRFVLKPGEKHLVMPFGNNFYLVIIIFSGSGEVLRQDQSRFGLLD